jgi:hypothetical protein
MKCNFGNVEEHRPKIFRIFPDFFFEVFVYLEYEPNNFEWSMKCKVTIRSLWQVSGVSATRMKFAKTLLYFKHNAVTVAGAVPRSLFLLQQSISFRLLICCTGIEILKMVQLMFVSVFVAARHSIIRPNPLKLKVLLQQPSTLACC